MVDNLILYLIFQPNVCSEEYSFLFQCFNDLAKETHKTSYFTLLGDLYDQNLFGRASNFCFEKRLDYYIKAGNTSRIISILILVHQKVSDIKLKLRLEQAIIEHMKQKQRYTAADFQILLRYSSMGVTYPLSPAFVHFAFPQVVSHGTSP